MFVAIVRSMTMLSAGQSMAVPPGDFMIRIAWPAAAGGLDIVAYMTGLDGKAHEPADRAAAFHPIARGNGVIVADIAADTAVMSIQPALVPRDVHRVLLCASTERPGQVIAHFDGLALAIAFANGTSCKIVADISETEAASMVLIDMVRESGTWRLQALLTPTSGDAADIWRRLHGGAAPRHQLDQTVDAPAKATASHASAKAALRLVRGHPGLIINRHGGVLDVQLDWQIQRRGADARLGPITLRLAGLLHDARGSTQIVDLTDADHSRPADRQALPWLSDVRADHAHDTGRNGCAIALAAVPTGGMIDLVACLGHGNTSWQGIDAQLILRLADHPAVAMPFTSQDVQFPVVALARISVVGSECRIAALAGEAMRLTELSTTPANIGRYGESPH